MPETTIYSLKMLDVGSERMRNRAFLETVERLPKPTLRDDFQSRSCHPIEDVDLIQYAVSESYKGIKDKGE
jgi:hypothetical protein